MHLQIMCKIYWYVSNNIVFDLVLASYFLVLSFWKAQQNRKIEWQVHPSHECFFYDALDFIRAKVS